MASDETSGKDLTAADSSGVEHAAAPGTAIVARDAVQDPGLPPHRPRITDLEPRAEKQAERTIYTLFYLSIVGSVFAIAAYMIFPIVPEEPGSVRLNNMFIGIGMALALLAIGIGFVHWGKAVMPDQEGIDERHPVRGSEEARTRAVEIMNEVTEESGIGRRTLIRNSLLGALVVFPLPAVVLFRGLAPQDQDPVALLSHTMWKAGTRLTLDPSGTPIKASDVTLGSSFAVIPDGLNDLEHGRLEEKAKSVVIMVRMKPEDLHELPERANWSYNGIVAYSKICTHVGCPVGLYEQQTHNLLCPCHQSQFDVANHAEVIFGPAKRALPQLPIAVDAEGYLIAQSDFLEPVGPSFWERQ